MKKLHFSIFNLLCTILLISGCTNEFDYGNSRDGKSKEIKAILSREEHDNLKEVRLKYDSLVREHQLDLYFKDWKYDEEVNNIIINIKDNKKAALELHNHRLGLGFDDFIAKENFKTLNYKAISPFAFMDKKGPYKNPLMVNGKLFSGVLVGTHEKTGKKNLEVRFYKGVRFDKFVAWTNIDRAHSKFIEDFYTIFDIEVVRKPVIYLYPEKSQEINVKVHFKGELIHCYPKYPHTTGWDVIANTDGMLKDKNTGKEYGYLFWEGKSDFKYSLDKGFVVPGIEIADFLDEKLELLGLNRREATDFVSYWLPELEKNPFNLIHFSTEEYVQNAPLEITPAPETLIRVFMVYKPLETPVDIREQELKVAKRKGFTVVEWGGKKATEFIY